MREERNPFRKVKLFITGYFVLLILMLTFIGIMDWCGYKMVDITLEFAFFTLLLCSSLVALTVWIVRRIMRGWLKAVVGSVAGIIILVLAMGIMGMMSIMLLYNIPMHYTTLTSPEGKTAVVLRMFSRDMEAADARAAERRAGNPESDAEYELVDLAYEYKAYPRVMKLFYNSGYSSEGSVEIGCGSEGQLMYDWIDENTLRMYIQNPDTCDKGELVLNMAD